MMTCVKRFLHHGVRETKGDFSTDFPVTSCRLSIGYPSVPTHGNLAPLGRPNDQGPRSKFTLSLRLDIRQSDQKAKRFLGCDKDS